MIYMIYDILYCIRSHHMCLYTVYCILCISHAWSEARPHK